MAGEFLLHSSELRRAIELCEKKPPTKKEGVLFEKMAADNATVKDIIPFDELEKNGIRVYSRWPDKRGHPIPAGQTKHAVEMCQIAQLKKVKL